MTLQLKTHDPIVLELAQRMQDYNYIQSEMEQDNKKNPARYNYLPFQEDFTLGNGCSSMILLFSALNQKNLLNLDLAKIIHQYVIKLKQTIEKRGVRSLSLFSGITGICFAMQQALLACQEIRYKKMLNTLEECLLANIDPDYLNPIRQAIQKNIPSPMDLYDVISGLSGIGRYALEKLSDDRFNSINEKIIGHLINRVQPMLIEGFKVPGWVLCSNDPYYSIKQPVSAKYTFNLGVAHGVAGILALLSISCLKDFKIEKQLDTVRFLADAIRSKSFIVDGRVVWASEISWEEEVGLTPRSSQHRKDPAWCYGTLGIARTLYLAGKALQDEELKSFALTAFRQIFQGRSSEWNLPTSSLCHGTSGLLLITHEMAMDTGCKDLLAKSNSLEKELIDQYNADFPLGFKDQEMTVGGNFIHVTNPGLINGTAGILLTLLHRKSPSQTWHLPLLIG